MKWRTWFLQACLGLVTLAAGGLCLLAFPTTPARLYQLYHNLVTAWIFTGGAYGAAACYFYGAVQGSRLLTLITRDQAFTAPAIAYLQRLKWAMAGITMMLCFILPQVYVAAQAEDAPGLIIVAAAGIAVPFVLAVFLAILQRLWAIALAYKTANDVIV
ncbi:DUF2975 domain-containing protein [Schleiferilactobacillus shenzhenensis]|uniref:DUF2975 domain-containing protein n=1 Tax=Schleiferilactobacillus shenzhenensis TaxID=1231337 RepID=UPI00042627D9|nr:DUF2975 domain-containing protein [Schleiferilactobacillus shenzhenensis]